LRESSCTIKAILDAHRRGARSSKHYARVGGFSERIASERKR
jgi:hypothetical protein